MVKISELSNFDMADELKTKEDILIYLNKAIFDNNIRYELQNTDDGKVLIKIQGMLL